MWNENTSHGNVWNFGQGSPTAADVTMLTQYILYRFRTSPRCCDLRWTFCAVALPEPA